jgi:hypothetical protein
MATCTGTDEETPGAVDGRMDNTVAPEALRPA